MVRNGLGVDARGASVRAASATPTSRLLVVEDAPFLDISEALRAALASARAKFGEPEAIALVHDDDIAESDLAQLRREAHAAGVGEVRLVPDSVARPLAAQEDVPPAAMPAMGAAIWLLRERRGVIVPPLLPPADEGSEGTRRMDDFGSGRRMSDFGAGSTMAQHGEGSSMADFGGGSSMADFGDGSEMADFGGPRRKGRAALVVAAVGALLVLAGVLASIGSAGSPAPADSVAATDTTEAVSPAEDTSTTAGIEAGAPATVAEETATTETTAEATTTTTVAQTTTTTVATTTRTYDVIATVTGYATDSRSPRLAQGDAAAGTVTLTCPTDGSGACIGSIDIPDFGYAISGFPAELVNGHVEFSDTEPTPPCGDGSTHTVVFSADFTDTSVSGNTSETHSPSPTCVGSDGSRVFNEDISISFRTPAQIR